MREERVITCFEIQYKGISLLEFTNIKEIFKEEYTRCKTNANKKRYRNLINTFPIAEYKKEKIWMYLNNDITEQEFTKFVESTFESVYKRRK